jgi:hypothetical protein
MFYFCRRGRENLRDLKASDFYIKVDENGRKYVMKKSEETKNHTGVTNEIKGDGARIYETGTLMCPVLSFEKYLEKRNKDCTAFLHLPRSSFTDEDECWYENHPLGKIQLENSCLNCQNLLDCLKPTQTTVLRPQL